MIAVPSSIALGVISDDKQKRGGLIQGSRSNAAHSKRSSPKIGRSDRAPIERIRLKSPESLKNGT
jgi:hypothetical protein